MLENLVGSEDVDDIVELENVDSGKSDDDRGKWPNTGREGYSRGVKLKECLQCEEYMSYAETVCGASICSSCLVEEVNR
jgi:hypothetical protein